MEINRTQNLSPMLQSYLKKSGVSPENAQQSPVQTQAFTVFPGSDLLKAYLVRNNSMNTTQGFYNTAAPVSSVNRIQNLSNTAPVQWENDLKDMFRNNEAVIMAVIPRTMNAKDFDGNGLIQGNEIKGNFVNDVERLGEIKSLGINTLHILPIHPPGKTNAMGTAGSVYAPDRLIEEDGTELLAVDPELVDENPPKEAYDEIASIYKEKTGRNLVKMDKNDPYVRFSQFKYFINQCHKNGINVMLDIPSCMSVDFAKRHPEMMAKEKDGVTDKTPGGWQDIRMLSPWENEEKRILNKPVIEMHKKYVDNCVDLGVDGIRADVARAKPVEFWNVIIPYSRSKDPEFAWLAETYTYEDASPQLNMPFDRPEDMLKAGFDSIYGQWHIYNQWTKAEDLYSYAKENIDMSNRMSDCQRSVIGSFTTHDDQSGMFYGGAPWIMLTTALQATLPQMCPYYVDGTQSGDYNLYPYEGQRNTETVTDTDVCTVHKGRLDIFNNSRKPGGNHPEIGEFMRAAHNNIKNNPEYQELVNRGDFVELETGNPEVIAYARHDDTGKTLLTVINRNVNNRNSAEIDIEGFKKDQRLDNLLPSYSEKSYFQNEDNKLIVDLGPSRAHVFEIDTPDIEKGAKAVYKQNFYNVDLNIKTAA